MTTILLDPPSVETRLEKALDPVQMLAALSLFPVAGYGSCTSCSCPGFSGSGYTCNRGGCGHHYDTHW